MVQKILSKNLSRDFFLKNFSTKKNIYTSITNNWKSSRHRDPFSFGDCGSVHRVPQMLVFSSRHRDPFSFGDCGPVHRVPLMLVFGSAHRDP